ncbi:MAG: peptidoglycan editing factor PgeF [Pseudomonadota bacterium]|nr:peptidoglycan editing factor PgeF [Pseudomonadota bacterium]
MEFHNTSGLYQIHSARCVTLTNPQDCAHRPEADAYVTALSGVGLAILTADCLPVLFCDEQAGVIGAAHAGWRGAAGGVIEATVKAMQSLGAQTRGIVCVIGPGIRQQSYQVSADMRDEIIAGFAAAETCFAADPTAAGKWRFDLPGFAELRGQAAGLSQIYDSGLDTYADEAHFFSHRRATHKGETDSGRLISVITQM